MRLLFLITTYNRSYYLKNVVKQIQDNKEHDISIYIYDDHSDVKHRAVNMSFDRKNITYYCSGQNLGKKGYWKVWDDILKYVKAISKFDYYFIIPDDFILTKDFINESIKQYEDINDPNKICLSLFIERERVDSTNWVEGQSELVQFGGTHYYRTQWMDMCAIVKYDFFKALGFNIKKVSESRWAESDVIGSGVGAQITKRLNKENHLYHVANSLCYEEEHESKMNPNRTQSYTPQCNRRDVKSLIHAGIASIPARENLLKRTIQSLIYQVDLIFVYLNNYIEVPEFCKHKKIIVFRSQDYGDRGDAGKFFQFYKGTPIGIYGYYFGCDDDLIYPGDYIYNMINVIENNNRKCIVGLHGITLKQSVTDYYRDRQVIHCLGTNMSNTFVHLLGTGAMAFHTDTIKLNNQWHKNMADISFGLEAQKQRIPMLCIKHEKDWLRYMDPEETIFDTMKKDCSRQTELVNSIKWKIHTVEDKYKILENV